MLLEVTDFGARAEEVQPSHMDNADVPLVFKGKIVQPNYLVLVEAIGSRNYIAPIKDGGSVLPSLIPCAAPLKLVNCRNGTEGRI